MIPGLIRSTSRVGEQTNGNQNCQAMINSEGLFDLKLNLPGDLSTKHQSKYLLLKDIKFHAEAHALLINSLQSRQQQIRVLSKIEQADLRLIKEQRQHLKKAWFKINKTMNFRC